MLFVVLMRGIKRFTVVRFVLENGTFCSDAPEHFVLRIIFVDDELYAERYSIERTNAWMDSFRTLLNRFDTTVSSWISWNYLTFAVLLLKKISRKQKV